MAGATIWRRKILIFGRRTIPEGWAMDPSPIQWEIHYEQAIFLIIRRRILWFFWVYEMIKKDSSLIDWGS